MVDIYEGTREATVRLHGGMSMKVSRDDHGTVAFQLLNRDGREVDWWLAREADALIPVFQGIPTNSSGAALIRLNRTLHDGLDTCTCNSSGECIHCGEYYGEMDHSRMEGNDG